MQSELIEVNKDDIHSGSDYVTLACQLSSSDKNKTVHLKVNFSDGDVCGYRDATVMQACAIIVGEAEMNTSGVYEGTVSMNEAAVASRYSGGSCNDLEVAVENKSVSIWLQDARAALTSQYGRSDDLDSFRKHGTEYVYSLQVQSEDDPETVVLSWKIKHKFLMVALGNICLSKVTAPSELVAQMSVKFIKPLICSFLTEKKRHQQVICASSKTNNQLLEDNKKLIDQIKLMTESRQHDDEQMMARFLEILNTKKLRIEEIKHELSQLKQMKNVENPVPIVRTDKEKLLTVTNGQRRRGRGRCHEEYKKTNSKAKVMDNYFDNNIVALKKQKTENMSVDQHFKSETMVMDVDVNIAAAVNKEEVKVFTVVDDLMVDPFEAITQIDPVSDNSSVDSLPESPSWLQPSSPVQVSEQPPIQLLEQPPIQLLEQPPIQLLEQPPIQLLEQSPIQLHEQPPIQLAKEPPLQSSPQQQLQGQKSFLDNLWDGIL